MTHLNIAFDAAGVPIQPTVMLANRDLSIINPIDVDDLTVRGNMASAAEISFSVHKFVDSGTNVILAELWEQLDDLHLVYVQDWNAYFEIAVQVDESDGTVKHITGKSFCESELGQILLYDIEINTESDIARDDYIEPTVLYNADSPTNSLLHRVLEKAPHYQIDHVDSSLCDLVRSFSVSDTSIYDFLSSTVAEEVGCLFVFGTNGRTVSVYDLENQCLNPNCRKRIGTAEVCPYCGGIHTDDGGISVQYGVRQGYGEDTTILISAENVAENLSRNGNADELKNCFRIVGGDDLMTATVMSINPNGTQYINYFSEDQKRLMPKVLVDKLDEYDAFYQSQRPQYTDLSRQYYDALDQKLYYQSTMMPSAETEDTNAQIELAKLTDALTDANMGTIAVSNLNNATQTISNAILAYAKVFVRSTYRVEMLELAYAVSDQKGSASCRFRISNYGDEDDIASNDDAVVLTVVANEERFIQQRIEKALAQYDVQNVEYDWGDYSLNALSGFETAYLSALDVLIEMGVSDKAHGSYPVYEQYKTTLTAIQDEMKVRESQIEEVDRLLSAIENERLEISNQLDIQTYLGQDLWLVLCSYRREQTYNNENFISDGLSNQEIHDKAQELFEAAYKDLIRASAMQYTLSCSMQNILIRKEFELLWGQFRLGNWLRMKVDQTIHKMRLISFELHYNQVQNLTVDFSDVIKTADGTSDLQSILNQAQSMMTSYEYVAKQAEQGATSTDVLSDWFKNGLDATLVKLVNNAKQQSVLIDGHGLLSKKFDDELNDYTPRQLKIINSGLYLTTDNWQSVETALGEFTYQDPETGSLKTAYGLNAKVVVGQLILGEEMRIVNDGGTFSVDENGLRLTNGVNTFVVNPNVGDGFVQILRNDGSVERTELSIDENGHLSIGAVNEMRNDLNLIQPTVKGLSGWLHLGDGSLQIGQVGSEGNPFSTLITGEKLSFYEDANEVAFISNKTMSITEAQITSTLFFGDSSGDRYRLGISPEDTFDLWYE